MLGTGPGPRLDQAAAAPAVARLTSGRWPAASPTRTAWGVFARISGFGKRRLGFGFTLGWDAGCEVSRGTSYGNNEVASIAVTGPGVVKFTFFTTEAGYDFLTILGTAYSGSSMPGDIEIPAGTHEIVWRSDGSVTTGGWIFRLESGASAILSVEVPQGTSIPRTADSLLVLTASEGGEMATGITIPLVDYNPPTIVPVSVQCEDTDPSIGVYTGFCNVRRAEVEVGVVSYDIYWGMNASHPIPGSPALGRAVLDASATALVTAQIPSTPIHSSASHLVALAAGPGGVAPRGVGTPVLDNSGLSLNPSSLNVVTTPGSTTSNVITVTSSAAEDITLQAPYMLFFESTHCITVAVALAKSWRPFVSSCGVAGGHRLRGRFGTGRAPRSYRPKHGLIGSCGSQP